MDETNDVFVDLNELVEYLEDIFPDSYVFGIQDDAIWTTVAGHPVMVADQDEPGVFTLSFETNCMPFEAAELALAMQDFVEVAINAEWLFEAHKLTEDQTH